MIDPHEDYASPCLELELERPGTQRPSHQNENLLLLDAPVTESVEYTQVLHILLHIMFIHPFNMAVTTSFYYSTTGY